MAKKTWLKDETNEQVIIPRTLVEAVQDANGNALSDILEDSIDVADDGEVALLPNTNPAMIFSDLDYSEEEQLTGKRWIDGKPIYQLTLVGDIAGGFQEIPFTTNIDTLVYKHINAKYNDGECTTDAYRKWVDINICINNVSTSAINIWSEGLVGKKYNLTVQYTKTTDTPQSPVKPVNKEQHVYDDTEKIVGTWFGKPLYEKSYTGKLSSTGYTEIETGMNFSLKNAFGVMIGQIDMVLGGYINEAWWSQVRRDGSIIQIWDGTNTHNFNYELTIQYTKTE